MQQHMQLRSSHYVSGSAGVMTEFAAHVVARVVSRDGADEAGLREHLVQRLFDAVTTEDSAAFEAVKPEFKRARISASAVADHYIPEVARRLGAKWEDDTASFALVTVGVARLQSMLRELGTNWTADVLGRIDGPTLMVLLPKGEQHTLGAMVLAGRLRRMGVSVAIQVAPDLSELANFLSQRTFDGALVSVTCEGRLESCRTLVKTLKDATKGSLMVAVGGAIIDDAENVKRLTGADVVTNDVSHALEAMGIFVGRSPVLELS